MKDTRRLLWTRAAGVLGIALFAAGASAAPPWLQLSVERAMSDAEPRRADFTVTWSCGSDCQEITHYNIRWGRKGEAERQSEISGATKKWTTTLTEPGVVHVFKLQSCASVMGSVGGFRPGGSSCSRWSEAELVVPAPPADLRVVDQSGWDGDRYVHRNLFSWRPGIGVDAQELRISRNGRTASGGGQLPPGAAETAVSFDPGESVSVTVCSLAESKRSAQGNTPIGCISLDGQATLPAPRKPKILAARHVGAFVEVSWSADNITEAYEVERLHRRSDRRAAIESGGAGDARSASRMRSSSAREETGSGSVWLKARPQEQGSVAHNCSAVGEKHWPRCMRDNPAQYAQALLGEPIIPYQYKICAVNKSGRTCSDFVAIRAIDEGMSHAARAVTPPPTAAAAETRALSRSEASPSPLSPGPAMMRNAPAGTLAKMEVNSNRAGGDYGQPQAAATAQACQSLCMAQAQCRAWTWADPQRVAGPEAGKCRLKNIVPAASNSPGRMSGVK